MAAKRKFTMAPLSDDEGEASTSTNLGGVNAFKKYKQQADDGKSSASIQKKSNGAESTINLDQVQRSNEKKPPEKNEEIRQEPQQDGNLRSGTGNAVPVATNPVGKNFRETFAYLKKTDLFVLPMPDPKPKPAPKNKNCIIVNSRQRGNPILKQIRNIPWEYGDIVPDYEIGQTSCALFLSMRYHSLNPDYIHERLKKLGNMYDLRVLLVQVDAVNCKPSLKELGRIAIYSNCTLILAWSADEAGRYLETFKSYEHKPPDILQQRVDSDHLSKMQDLLTTIKSINKTDVITLLSTFGSLRNIVNATKQEITDCPGLGSQKANRLYNAFNEPFKRATSLASRFQLQDVSTSTKNSNKDKKLDSFTELPPECQLKRPTSSQTSTDTEAKKVKKTEKPASKFIDNDKEKTDVKNFAKEKQPKANLHQTSNGSTTTPPVASSDGRIEKESQSIDVLSKSEAIHHFMKGKNKATDKKQKNSNTANAISKTGSKEKSKSVPTVTSITARLRNELKQRTLDIKKTEISTLTNTSSRTAGTKSKEASDSGGGGKGLGNTHITDDDLKDLVASSDDDEDEDEDDC